MPPHECEHTRDIEASKALNAHGGPMMILIAGSGMATGGRILHHLKSYGPDPTNGVLLVGYQAAGPEVLRCATAPRPSGSTATTCPSTPSGRRSTSGHADWKELVAWVRAAPRPSKLVLNHGEPGAADALRMRLREELSWDAEVATDGLRRAV